MQNRTFSVVLLTTVCIALLLSACHQHTYDFSYSPTAPKAGERVTFTNQSDAGENWVWKFGDGMQSTLKNPVHTYTQAGTYVVELMVDSSKHKMMSHTLTVFDSVPSIALSATGIRQYDPFTLKANIYNPSNNAVSYSWHIDTTIFTITYGGLTKDSLVGYFTQYGFDTDIAMTITVGNVTTTDTRTLTLLDHPAPSLLLHTATDSIFRQRIYDNIYEAPKPFEQGRTSIDQANDTCVLLNGVTYDIHNMPVLQDKAIQTIQADPINRKIYMILPDGIYVANANGDALTCIYTCSAHTILVDGARNTLFWSDTSGVHALPLVTTPLNTISPQLLSKIRNVNPLPHVQQMLIVEAEQ